MSSLTVDPRSAVAPGRGRTPASGPPDQFDAVLSAVSDPAPGPVARPRLRHPHPTTPGEPPRSPSAGSSVDPTPTTGPAPDDSPADPLDPLDPLDPNDVLVAIPGLTPGPTVVSLPATTPTVVTALGGTPAAAKSADTCAFNNALITARHGYWDNVAIGSQSFLTSAGDPYLYC